MDAELNGNIEKFQLSNHMGGGALRLPQLSLILYWCGAPRSAVCPSGGRRRHRRRGGRSHALRMRSRCTVTSRRVERSEHITEIRRSSSQVSPSHARTTRRSCAFPEPNCSDRLRCDHVHPSRLPTHFPNPEHRHLICIRRSSTGHLHQRLEHRSARVLSST